MRKSLIIFLTSVLLFQNISAQRIFSFKISLDKSIDPAYISCSYFNGKKEILCNDTFTNSCLLVTDTLYSAFTSFHIEYKLTSDIYRNDFFINENPAEVNIYIGPNLDDHQIKYTKLVNAIPIYDTSANRMFKALAEFREKEAKVVSDFWERYSAEVSGSDSLSRINKNNFIQLNHKTISFLKAYSHDYFAFWYFRDQVIMPALTFFKNEPNYLKGLIDTLLETFAANITESIEGRQIVNLVQGMIYRPKINEIVPGLKFTDITGEEHELVNFKGKYILLDFWASWCPPCMAEIPFLKKIRDDFSTEKLILIGINKDNTLAKCKEAISTNSMKWLHVYDDDNTIQNLFGVQVYPTTVLIDKNGVVVYDSRDINNKNSLLDLLSEI